MRLRPLLLCVALLLVTGGTGAAQDTGGSIGGGDWGGGGGGGGDYSDSSGGSDYSSSGGGDSSYSGGSTYSSGGGGSAVGALIGLGLAAGFIVLGLVLPRHAARKRRRIGPRARRGTKADVTALRFGLDARVRPFVQKELDRIAKRSDTGSQAGLVTTLHEVALMLRRLRDAWVYGGAENHDMAWKETAQSTFQQHAAAARSAFRTELVRNAAGVTTTQDATARTPRGDEGPGLVLVTLIVAARQELFTVKRVGTGDHLRRALEVLSGLTAQDLIAVEIVWTPADPDDRMSSVELEAMLAGDIFPIQGAMTGKVVCSYCSGPFPAELISCPHCGAPARDAGAPRSGG